MGSFPMGRDTQSDDLYPPGIISAVCVCTAGIVFFGSGIRPLVESWQSHGGGVPHREYQICMSSGGWCPGLRDGSLAETYDGADSGNQP